MRLSEFYSNEKFYNVIDGVSFPLTSCKTENGELYIDEERNLFYEETYSKSSVLLCSDVGEWIYINDNKIVCSLYYIDNAWDEIYVRIVDIQKNATLPGSLTKYGLVYARDNKIIKENSKQEATVIFALQNSKTPIMFWEDSFSIPFYYPHSKFLYEKHYDYDGNYLEEKTKECFLRLFIREFAFAFLKPFPLTGTIAESLSVQQSKLFNELDRIRFGTTKITFELIERIISLTEEMQLSDNYTVRGYQIIKKVLIKNDITDNLVKPLLNIMTINRSGEFGRISLRWISLTNAKRIEKIAKKSKNEFKNIIYDIELLWDKMKTVE